MTTSSSTSTTSPARASRTRLDAALGLAARLLGFGAILASLGFAAWGWCLTLVR